jgi:hypothetical protein
VDHEQIGRPDYMKSCLFTTIAWDHLARYGDDRR